MRLAHSAASGHCVLLSRRGSGWGKKKYPGSRIWGFTMVGYIYIYIYVSEFRGQVGDAGFRVRVDGSKSKLFGMGGGGGGGRGT